MDKICVAVTRKQAAEEANRHDSVQVSSMDVAVRDNGPEDGDEASDSGEDGDPDERSGVRVQDVIDDPEERVILIREYHSSILGGHFGIVKTYYRE